MPIKEILDFLDREENFVFLDTTRCDPKNFRSYIFCRPDGVISCDQPDRLEESFEKIERALAAGYYAAGFISYEAGYVFEKSLIKLLPKNDLPLLWFGIFYRPEIFNHQKGMFEEGRFFTGLQKKSGQPGRPYFIKKRPAFTRIRSGNSTISREEYLQKVNIIKELIAAGDTYQVNFTFKNLFSFSGLPADLYLDLREKQKVAYGAFLKAGRRQILSFSPELFFRLEHGRITARPMKGTCRRGLLAGEDRQLAGILKSCPKNRSENLMIVDMMRNDLGQIAPAGRVQVKQLFEVEKFQTLFQMTSLITAGVKAGSGYFKVFKSLFPPASVTGAPKIRTMEIIRELEKYPRGIYTGAIGFFGPGEKAVFNVAIRTAIIDQKKKTAEMGIGSGIIYDSLPADEYRECRLKGRFLNSKKPGDFQLVETMRWESGPGILLLDYHLKRLRDSAEYFDFPFSRRDIVRSINKASAGLKETAVWRLRLTLDQTGAVDISSEPLARNKKPGGLVFFSKKKVNSSDSFLFHKTSYRPLYLKELARARLAGFMDVLFTNEKGQVTEGAISNIFIKKSGRLFTPPVKCGLLNGVYRQYYMANNQVLEKYIYPADVIDADQVFLTNAVRGLIKVEVGDCRFGARNLLRK